MDPEAVDGGLAVLNADPSPDEARAPELEGPSPRHRRRPWLQIALQIVFIGAAITFAWFERTTVGQSIRILGHAQWGWLLAAAAFELLSMMAFARTQRIILRAAGVHAPVLSVAATALAGNAIAVSIPLIGPGAGSVFSFGRFRQAANDPAPAGWTLLIAGLISNLVWILLIAIGATVSGNPAAALSGLLGGAVIVVTTIVGIVALGRPRSRKLIIRQVARLVRISQRLSGRPVGDPEEVTESALDALSAFRMRGRDWVQAVGLSCINWFAGVACLVAAILSVGAEVPWTKVILIYCAGAAASSFNLTPGGLGVTEAVLAAGLVATRMKAVEALGSVLIFRFFSFWLVVLIGWSIYSDVRRKRVRRESDTRI
jgi:hypothetical protein